MSAANWGFFGGGAKYFFSGPKCPPSFCSREKVILKRVNLVVSKVKRNRDQSAHGPRGGREDGQKVESHLIHLSAGL